jgi:hypothetical protein
VRRIEEWLGDLALGEYAARFVENDADFEILGDLVASAMIGLTEPTTAGCLRRSHQSFAAAFAEPLLGVQGASDRKSKCRGKRKANDEPGPRRAEGSGGPLTNF